MTSVIRLCPTCGAEIPPDAPEGGCPGCLLQTGLDPLVSEDGHPSDLTRVQPATGSERSLEILGDLGDYELLEEIGRGGQGIVYRARQKSLNRTVALKVIGLGQWATKAHLKRFRLEAEAAASLEHPCIVPIYEVGERHGACYFSMGLVEGDQLDAVSMREPMPIRRAAELVAKLARTVHYAHERGILHRDIKPGNILLDAKGEPHLTDFGLARLVETESTVTRTLEVLGTPSYMAPEQAVGNKARVTSATDIFGLGAVLYQLLTGHPPFAGGTTFETVRLVLDTEPRQPRLLNPKVDRDLNTICLKCLEKDPKRRYASALALAEDLERWLKHEPIRAHRTGIFTRGKKWLRRNPSIAVMAAMLVVLAVPLGVMIWKTESERSVASNPAPPEKSIAVLPFSNLSKEQENAFFADGVQDEILTDLAKVADLKVISRTSVMPYKSGMPRNVRQIGQQLEVAHVVEGSVQRIGNRVRVNAQLVDARTDRHLWAQTYDRDLADVFTIQSEIAKTIADQLQANLSPSEKNAIELPPTRDISAFDPYTRAKNILLRTALVGKAHLLEAVDLLNQAVARDPSFFDAYCQLAYAHDALYFFGDDHTSARLALAEAALQAASRLRPDAGETHLARGQNLYWAYGDYDGALAELEVARQTLPNDARIFGLTGLIQRRQGHWEESTQNLERAVELNPRDIETLVLGVASNYSLLRRYGEAKPWLARALAFEPNDAFTKVWLAYVDFDWKADTRPLHQTIDSIRATNPTAVPSCPRIICPLAERDAAAAKDTLIAFGQEPIQFTDNVLFNRPFAEGVIARMTKDDEKARSAFTAARAEQEKIVQAQPNYGPALCVLGLIDAGLGRKEEALREGRRAVELLPVEKDSMNGANMVKYLAMIAAWVGDKDLACEQLASIIRRPSSLSYGQLKLLPFWDPLRGDPRFEKLVEESKQPVALQSSTSSALGAADLATAPDKSIAVLPFENLSRDPDNAFFAGGVQDEILTNLAKIADLKVISRTSVMQYKSGIARNLRQIARELGVANILEGSAQKSGDAVRVNVQLIKAANSSHLWAETFDRKLTDVFSVESEVAKAISDQLRVKLSGREEQVIAAKPTQNLAAYDAYLRGLSLEPVLISFDAARHAADAYAQAVRLDPKFALAWARLAVIRSFLYFNSIDLHSNTQSAVEEAVDRAMALAPDAGESLIAQGAYRYRVLRDFEGAVLAYKEAQKRLPNSSFLLQNLAFVLRRTGRWQEAEANFKRALELDPRDVTLLNGVGGRFYNYLRRFDEAHAALDRALEISPDSEDAHVNRAGLLQSEGRLTEAGQELARIPEESTDDYVLLFRVGQAMYERQFDTAISVIEQRLRSLSVGQPLDSVTEHVRQVTLGNALVYLGFCQAWVGRQDEAHQSFTRAIEAIKPAPNTIVAPGGYGVPSILALAYAGLGEKQQALEQAQRAVKDETDAINKPTAEVMLAQIQALFGERDAAIAAIPHLLKVPAGITVADLRFDPFWDPLRKDPRFQKLVASSTPK